MASERVSLQSRGDDTVSLPRAEVTHPTHKANLSGRRATQGLTLQ